MADIKMFCAIPRRPDVSRQYFHDHWRHPHGSWALEIAEARRYVQMHRVDTDRLPADQARYEGIVEVWFDTVEHARDLPDNPMYQKYLAPDEPNFIDMTGIRFLFTDEEVVEAAPTPPHCDRADVFWVESQRPVNVKLIQLIVRDGDLSWAQDDDLALGRRIGALRHVRCRVNSEVHPDGADFIGVRELWWPTLSDFETGVARDPGALAALLDRPAASNTIVGTAERVR